MKRCLIILFFWLLALNSKGQSSQKYWDSGTNFVGIFSFHQDSLLIDSVIKYIPSNMYETNACFTSAKGDFLYTNGRWLRDKHGRVIQGGDSMTRSTVADAWYGSDGLNWLKSFLFIPFPGDSNLLYLFADYPQHTFSGYAIPEHLFYSIIDLSGDNGNPKVTSVSDSLFSNTKLMTGRLTATRHANGIDWWLVCHKYNSDLFYKFLITKNGISSVQTQHIGSNLKGRYETYGDATFSQDGKHYVIIGDEDNSIDVYDFNRCTGEFSNWRHDSILFVNFGSNNIALSSAFSPSGRFLYVNKHYKLYQYDLNAVDFASSRTLIDTSDHYSQWGIPGDFGFLRLAPNNKIYLSTWNGIATLHQINYPDSLGLSCHFVQHFDSFILDTSASHYVAVPFPAPPNVVNYDLSATPLYKASAGSNKNILQGQSVSIGSPNVSGVIYQWNPATGLNNSTIAQPTASPQQTTIYILTITDTSGVSGCDQRADTVTVFVTDAGCEIKFPTLISTGEKFQQLNYSEHFAINIFNALGQLIFVSDDYNGNWKPEVKGFYIVKLQCKSGTVKTFDLVVD